MYHIKQLTVVCMVLILITGCAGQPVKNSAQPTSPDCETAGENEAGQWDSDHQRAEMQIERNRRILTDALIVALAVTEICLFWYFTDKHHDSKGSFLWIGPIWPLWY